MQEIMVAARCAFAMAAALAVSAHAQYPVKPIRVIVPQEAGSGGDASIRAISTALSEALGQPLVIENRPGAGGALGMAAAAAAAPDGYNMVAIASPQMVLPFTHKNLNYDLVRDFVPIGRYSVSYNVLVVPAGLPVVNVKDLIELARSNPGKLNMGTAGPGSATHLAGALFNALAGIQALTVPYKGGAAAVIGLVSSEVQYYVTPLQAVLGQIRSGRLKALGVGSDKRAPQLPDVPTIAEAGLAGYRSIGWGGILMPRATSVTATATVTDKLAEIIKLPAVRQQIFNAGAEPNLLLGAEFAKFMGEDLDRFRAAAQAANLRPE